ncbi:hypothetical protein F5879DRAFT_468084 [Lentinula edodes]|nr:hypothetical protein F5879DRAFT_468084 [Lentinula edodes]
MPKVSVRSRSDSSSETNGTRFPCKSCDKTFDRSSDYRRHERTHTGERPHRCTWPGCSKSFAQSSGLKTHMNTHTGAQPHLCGYCDSKFGDPSSRSRHRREVHGDEGTHECPYAGCHSTIKRPKMFYDHVYEKHNVRLTPEEVEACNPYIRNGICPRSKRSQSGRKSARTLVLASTSPSTALEPTYLYADGVESSPILQLPVPLAVPIQISRLATCFIPTIWALLSWKVQKDTLAFHPPLLRFTVAMIVKVSRDITLRIPPVRRWACMTRRSISTT